GLPGEPLKLQRIAPHVKIRVDEVQLFIVQDDIRAERLAGAVEGGMEVGSHLVGATVRPEHKANLAARLWPGEQQVEENLPCGGGPPPGGGDRHAVPYHFFTTQGDHAQAECG